MCRIATVKTAHLIDTKSTLRYDAFCKLPDSHLEYDCQYVDAVNKANIYLESLRHDQVDDGIYCSKISCKNASLI